MAVRNDHDGGLIRLQQFHMHRFRGTKGVGDKGLGFFVPRHDVNFLALEFVHYALDPVATDADAGANRVDAGLGSAHGYLAAEPGLAGDGFDLDHAVVDLGHLNLEQAFKHVLVASGDQDLRSLGRASYADQVDLGALSLAVALVGGLFFVGEHCLSATQVQGDGSAGFSLLNHA